MDFKVFKQVPRIIYGNGSLARIREVLPVEYKDNNIVIIIDAAVVDPLSNFLKSFQGANILPFDASKSEPYTDTVDSFCSKAKLFGRTIDAIVGVGGGSTMDVAKGVSIALNNPGSIAGYQGWDLVINKPIFKLGIPTLFGSGSEASRTAVFNNGVKKQGVNSDYSMFDGIIIDPELSQTASRNQKVYTAMDCYIHCVESLEGTYINQIAKGFAEKALSYCCTYFDTFDNEELIATASYYGGVSIVNSEVGVCHALSYGLSTELGLRHGVANCIVFRILDEFYGTHVERFREIIKKLKIDLPTNVCASLTDQQIERMIDQTLLMHRPLENALGADWKNIFSREDIKSLYKRM
jgi:3-deoxy-alpha-D-manno-octulosonate 8-oxidase